MARKLTFVVLTLAAFTLAVGCGGPRPETPPAVNASKEKTAHPEAEHAHKPRADGSRIVSIGRDNYHAAVRMEANGVLRLLILDRDETKSLKVTAEPLTAHARAEGTLESVPFELKPMPLPDDPAGKTSQFLGQLPEKLRGSKVEIIVPLEIAGEHFRFTFSSAEPAGHAGMPKGVARGSENERRLYLQPGGIYTLTDIQANGHTIPSEKFQGISWPHDDDLKVGDKVCPVTANKADPRCNWVVNGKTYEFCCSPCLDKFVGWAKNQPQKIKEPEEYVYKK